MGVDTRGRQPLRLAGGAPVKAWAILAAVILPIGCGGGTEAGPPANRDTISLEDPAPPEMGAVDEIDLEERDTIAVERDTIAEEAHADTVAVADTAAAAAGSWTAGVVDIPTGDGGVSTLASVRTARHEGFDRVVWELEGALPGVHVEYVDQPVRTCGSGEPPD